MPSNAKHAVSEIPIKDIAPAPGNRTVDPDSVATLKASIAAQGLLTPILVRKHATKSHGRTKPYQIVYGQRRWMACAALGWKTIPAEVRTLTDTDAQLVRFAENLERQDLSPLEEAAQIAAALDTGCSPQEVAAKIGREISWVVRRAKLQNLSPAIRSRVEDPDDRIYHDMPALHLEMFARMPHDIQDAIVLYDRPTTERLREMFDRHMNMLSSAPWKIGQELANVGPCTKCQTRTGADLDLFGDLTNKKGAHQDRCLDTDCWQKKMAAHIEQKAAQLKAATPDAILLDKSYNRDRDTVPESIRSEVTEDRNIMPAKKGEPGARPALVVAGPDAGQTIWVKPLRPDGARGRGRPKLESLEDRRKALHARRLSSYGIKLARMLRDIADATEPPPEDRKPYSAAITAMAAAVGASAMAYGADNVARYPALAARPLDQIDGALMQAVARQLSEIVNRAAITKDESWTKDHYDICANWIGTPDATGLWQQILDDMPDPRTCAKLEPPKKEAPDGHQEDPEKCHAQKSA